MPIRPAFLDLIASRRSQLRKELSVLLPSPVAITWEIGCGHGHFLTAYASVISRRFHVGIDLRLERIIKARRKGERAGLANCHFVRCEAREFLNGLPPHVTFSEIWVLFPDPWPKVRHHKNRLLQPKFFEAVAGRTEEGTPLYFRTDHVGYFREVYTFLASLTTWRLASTAVWPLEWPTVFQSRAPSYHSLVALRTAHPAKPTVIVAPELPAPEKPTSPA